MDIFPHMLSVSYMPLAIIVHNFEKRKDICIDSLLEENIVEAGMKNP